jgi:RNA polymerase sigma-54 factor
MQMNTSLSMRPEMRQIIAPRMIQSMEILQLPIMALQERLEHELQENPVLELAENKPELDEDGNATEAPAAEATDDSSKELEIDDKNDFEKDFDRLEEINKDWDDHFNEETRPSSNRIDEEMDKKHDAMANMAARPESLQEYLENQLGYLELEPKECELVEYLISHLDDRGYLGWFDEEHHKHIPYTLEELAAEHGGDVTVQDLEDALSYLQELDPPGVGARDTKECLMLQVAKDTPYRDVVKALIQNHLEDIQHNRLPIIQKRTGYDLETIQLAIEVLKHLNPKPGAAYTSENIPYVTPDIVVERDEKGEYNVRLVDDWLPQVYISKRYIEMYRDKNADPKAREYLKRKIQAAQWLLDAVQQRQNTLINVTKAIIQHQRAFLDKGPEHIEPLKMQQIADIVGVHVTTVSRAVDDKWVQTPRGIFPLKRFFGGGTQTASGEEVAWETIKNKLLEIVGGEDKGNPLSDEDLVSKLQESGYPVARRTVTKYRKMLHIPSSRQRKVWTGD